MLNKDRTSCGSDVIPWLLIRSVSRWPGVPPSPGQVIATRNTKSSVFVQWEAPKHLKNLMGYYIDGRVVGSKDWFPCNHKPFKHNR